MTMFSGWCANQDDTCIAHFESYECETKEDAIVPLAKLLDLLPGEKIVIGINSELVPYCDGEDVADRMIEFLDEIPMGDCGSTPSEWISDEDRDDLAKRIESAFDAWVADRKISMHYSEFLDTATHVIPDYLAGEE